ncbi:anthranilate synthase component I [Bacillus sp. AFS017336]|uniref:anthranilate synthase component I n=1 Tax=Bacillus sp. AFS017336 TaxID=2033489 RepID=UPI000BEF5497|nr:anthranilate synthase component I [Bacillus sp. AFS017336]PEL08106.1 anthranilate synthase component I [Bacillus sp. AFS017336]
MGVKHKAELFIETIAGDLFTPISVFKKLSGSKKFLFESSYKHQDSGRYSFVGSNPTFELVGTKQGGQIIDQHGETKEFIGNPLLKLKELLLEQEYPEETDFPFIGGGIGYVGYDIIRQFEEIGEELEDVLEMPDLHLMFFEVFIVFDHLEQKIHLVGTKLSEDTTLIDLKAGIQRLMQEIFTNAEQEEVKPVVFSTFNSEISKADYMSKVEKAKQLIQKGDIFQVVLSHRMGARFDGDPFDYYRKLRIKNPSPYMYFIDFGDSVVAGTSPESLIKVQNNQVITNPIAGTKKRGKTPEQDLIIERNLLQDEKELAEHKMLVDLGRNDLGKVCEFGTVKLDKYMNVEKYKYVMHIVSEVSGQLKKTNTTLDALIACLPAGTVSGAPKIRAMEIINELEVSKRGVYSGAVGYVSVNGNLDFALAIRTMILKNQMAYIQAGAGIVYDSKPDQEYEETINKLKAFLEEHHDFIN